MTTPEITERTGPAPRPERPRDGSALDCDSARRTTGARARPTGRWSSGRRPDAFGDRTAWPDHIIVNPMQKVVFYRRLRKAGGRCRPARLATAPANVYLVHQIDAESRARSLFRRFTPMSRRSVTRLVAAATRRDRHARRSPAARPSPRPTKDSGASTEPVTLRLGYFANVTHAPAIVGARGRHPRQEARHQRRRSKPASSTRAPRP